MKRDQIRLAEILKKHSRQFYPVVSFAPLKQKLIQFDFTQNNKALATIDPGDIDALCEFIHGLLQNANATFGIGGYNELRNIYSRSELFGENAELQNFEIEEPRRLHLGADIWGKEGTEIFSPYEGTVHSFAFNDNYGDYGATIILRHHLEDFSFYTLYGHVSLGDLADLQVGQEIKKGQLFAHFGKPAENGHWPPHLHFQLINNIGDHKGDYPGVCKDSEKASYLLNSPDPDFILNMNKFIC
jgi:peptidoglycan LD-endopeptidase LytH